MIELEGKVWAKGNEDGCRHPEETYVGSFGVSHVGKHAPEGGAVKIYPAEWKEYDLYVFPRWESPPEQSICIRFGNEPQEYYSPGPVIQFIQTAIACEAPHYWGAYQLMREKGIFSWKVKQKQETRKES